MKNVVKLSLILALLVAFALPMAAFAQDMVYTTGFQVQNLNTTQAATVQIRFVSQTSSVADVVVNASIPAGSSTTYFPLNQVTDGFNGSVVISSDVQVAAIANVLGNSGQSGASYVGFSSGSPVVNLPLVMRNYFNINSWFNIQNTGTSDATVTITYKPGVCTETKTIRPNASVTVRQWETPCLIDNFVGAATVDAGTGSIAVSVMQVTQGSLPNLLAYNGFTTSSTNPVMPLISTGWYGSLTGIQIMNVGTASTDVTVSFSPSTGFPGAACTETKTIAAGTSQTFGLPMAASCKTVQAGQTAFVGSAKVTANTASQNLNAIVNQITSGKASGAAYGAFNSADATATVSLPLIMDRNYNIFTGFSVANVGASATNIACTFSNSTVTIPSTSVAPGAALTHVQVNALAAGYVGSATCTATGGDAKIAAVVNEATAGAAATKDALLVYEGINY